MTIKNKPTRRTLFIFALLSILAVVILLWVTKPWREALSFSEEANRFSYLVVYSAGAKPGEALPMIIGLHGVGDAPEFFRGIFQQFPYPARIILPAGESWWGWGHSWFPLNVVREVMATEAKIVAERLAGFTRALVAHYPTQGKPIVTGFSQGGILSFALAVHHGDLYAAAIPVAGTLLASFAEVPGTLSDLPVRALHGTKDTSVLLKWAEDSVDEMQAAGWDVSLQTFLGLGHVVNQAMLEEWHRLLIQSLERESLQR